MRREGYITVFLSFILLCVSCLLLGLVESARTAGARWYLQLAANSAMDSLFSQYHQDLWEQYRLFGLEYRDLSDIENWFLKYLDSYESADNWYPMDIDQAEIVQVRTLTDEGGAFLEQQVLEYMKYGIWNMDFEPDALQNIPELLTEASAVEAVSDAYSSHTKTAFRLEEALEAVEVCQQKQKGYYEEGMRSLQRYDGTGFRQAASNYIREAGRLDGLVKTYEKFADKLGLELSDTQKDYENKKQDIGSTMSLTIEQEMNHYRSYTDEDGQRRAEIRKLKDEAKHRIQSAEEAVKMAEAVEELIDQWDDEDDDLDLDSLWEPVERQFKNCFPELLGIKCGVKDKEKQGWLESLKSLTDSAILSIVLPEGYKVSNAKINQNHLPSQYINSSGSSDISYHANLLQRMMIHEYCDQFFADFLEPETKEILYELEYLVAGKGTDKENLTAAVMELIALREGMNLAYLFTDSQKRSEAYELAQAIVGITGIGPLVLITAFFILVVWALAESVSDVRQLLHSGRIPLWKSKDSWKLSLEQLLEFGKTKKLDTHEGGSGLNYQGYLKILLLLKNASQHYYRMMDVIQWNLSQAQPDFEISRCAHRVDIRGAGCGKHVFFSIGFVDRALGQSDYTYPMSVQVQKEY